MVKKSNTAPKDIYAWDINQWKAFIKALETIINSEKKPDEKKLALANMVATNNKVEKFNKKLKDILEDHKVTPYEKKVNLFNLVKDLDVGESQPLKEQRMNYLLESRLYEMLAKKALEDYKKTTVKTFSKTKQQI